MHEMSLTQGIVDTCLKHAAGRPIKMVLVEIGSLSGVLPEAVQFCFEAIASGTVAEGASLEIRRVKGVGQCLECSLTQPMEQIYDPCSGCGSFALDITAGKEMRLLEIEVEEDFQPE